MTETMTTCIQCDTTYSSEMFSVRVRICDVCRENNKIKRIERQKQWNLNNPEKLKAYTNIQKRERRQHQGKEETIQSRLPTTHSSLRTMRI